MTISIEQERLLQKFYYQEARLLDSRQYRQWFELLHTDIQYVVPARGNPMPDPRLRGEEAMLAVERELEGLDNTQVPLREENWFLLQARVERAYKLNAWAENPPARTRRLITNIELQEANAGSWQAVNNFLLFYSRNDEECLYAGQRRDTLVASEATLQLVQRTVVLDSHLIDKPTVGLFF
jgi:3-phenylpropionate/cinnamic acid dioxygenase small subunit